MQSDQGLHCMLTESLDTTECMDGEQDLPGTCVYAQDDLNLSILCMLEGTFSLDAAHLTHNPFLIFSQSDYLIQIVDINSYT